MTYVSAPLTEEHLTADFRCGKEPLDTWLKDQARRAQNSDTARTYVWTEQDSKIVLAYYSVAPTQVVRDELTSGQAGGLSAVPAYLLARLALDVSLHSQGLGSELLIDALQTIYSASRRSGGRLIVVDAIDDSAARFYQKFGFTPVKGNPNRLVMKMATVRNEPGLIEVGASGDQQARLASLTFTFPDGTVQPVAASEEDLERLQEAIMEAASEGIPVTLDNLRTVFERALGRDPF